MVDKEEISQTENNKENGNFSYFILYLGFFLTVYN